MSKHIIPSLLIILLKVHHIIGVSTEDSKSEIVQSEINILYEDNKDNNDSDIGITYDMMNASSFICMNNATEYTNITASIQFGSFLLENYTFKVIESNKTGFIIGLGIRPNFSNDLVRLLKQHQYIDKQILYYSSNPKQSIQFPIDKRKLDQANFTSCGLTERKDLDAKYHNSWVCDYTHIKPTKANLMNEMIEINGRAVFDANSQYIIAPIEYITVIQNYFALKANCDLFVDEDSGEIDFHCNMTRSDIDSMPEIAFMFEGIAYAIPGSSLFIESNDDNDSTYYSSLIIFRKEKKNLWFFGYPFLKHYHLELDYDNKEIGFRGYKAYDMTEEWSQWKHSKTSFINRVYNDKRMMIIGIVFGSAILFFVFVVIIRAFRKIKDKGAHSELIEEGY